MEEKTLTREERGLLEEELKNSRAGRRRNIKAGLVIIFIFLTVVLLTTSIERGQNQQINRLLGAVTNISILTTLFGLFKVYYWIGAASEIHKLEKDVLKGRKVSGRLKIIGYNFLSREIKFENGTKIDRYQLGDNWKNGDYVDIEYLPTSVYILKCDKNGR